MNWGGHKPATTAALIDSITTATTGSAPISHFDRVLFTACEFWASANNRSLLEQLGDGDAGDQLLAAESAFREIGVAKAADVVQRGRLALTASNSPTPLQQVVEEIERSLADSDEPVDQLIAEYAEDQLLNRQAEDP
jgi:hypothetical protein